MNGETAGMIGNNTFMEINLVFLTNILTHPPGNLVYHLVIIFALSLVGFLTIPKLNSEEAKNQARQTLTGCAILLIMQIVLFAASLVITLSPFTASLIEVLCYTLTIIWLIWIFHEQDPEFFLTGVNIFLSLAFLIIVTTILILAVVKQPAVFLDQNMVIISWQIGAIILTALGMILFFTGAIFTVIGL